MNKPVSHGRRRSIAAVVCAIAAAVGIGTPMASAQSEPRVSLPSPAPANVDFWLTVLHNNDGESRLLEENDFGGIARFTTLMNELRFRARLGKSGPEGKRGVLVLSSGDNFLAGAQFNASLVHGVPYFDGIAMDIIGYDATTIGNHEFDLGPDICANFIRSFQNTPLWKAPPFVTANLDFSLEPNLQTLVDDHRIVKSLVIKEQGQRIGIVGATTELLPTISSPRDVIVNEVRPAVEAEIAALQALGIDKIILVSHLQAIQEDLNLLAQITGVDIAIAGGGHELLASEGDLLIPGDEGVVQGPYPVMAVDAEGREVPVVTTSGNYRYVGRLIVGFDQQGRVVAIDDRSGPVRVAGGANPDAVERDFLVEELVVAPVAESVAGLDENVIGFSEVDLDGRRSQVRTRETNEGNLIADSILYQASALASSFGAPVPQVALQNGGGIRNDTIIPAGPLTELDTFSMVPFLNFVCIVPAVSRDQFKLILENAVSRVEFTDGRFAQIAGFSFTWDSLLPAGSRVVQVVLDGGELIVDGGAVIPGDPIDVATIDFLARNGDQYPFDGVPFVNVGVTYQQALFNYIAAGLGGVVTAADYPAGGEGRITRLP